MLALAATLLLAAPAGALAAGPRVDRGSDGWSLAWKGLADLWDGMREAVAGLIPTWQKDTVPVKPGPLPPPQPPPAGPEPPPPGDNPFDDGDTGSGLDPSG